ncbi:MAG: hypothetical protein ACYC61_00165 [Isosphaeraceae bacterium]
MGYCPYYQAIPEDSELFARLRTDERMALVLDQFFPRGSRPLDLDEDEKRYENDEILDAIAQADGELFSSRDEVAEVFDALHALIAQAERAHPGLLGRTAFLDKTQDTIGASLVERLSAGGHADAREMADRIICGGERFARGFEARLNPAETVARIAEILLSIEAESLWNDEDELDDLGLDYGKLRNLYLAAAVKGEAVLVY